MTKTMIEIRQCSPVLWIVLAMLPGCSSEPSAPTTNSAPESAKAHQESTLTPRVPWNSETLKDDGFSVEEGFRALTLSDFEPFFAKPPQSQETTWLVVHDAIVCFGKPKGYLYSKEKFADFTLRLEMRFAPPAEDAAAKNFNPNTGVMLFITEPHKQWPKSLEVQGRFAELGTIKANGGAGPFQFFDEDEARKSARKPAGEWNALEIVAKAGAVTAILNGTKVCESQPSDVTSGLIGLQSEDFEVHFRRLRIRPE